ncbi:MAG: restriction endonuclease subunit S, partial [Clostridia bacterium]|nr:restriction endonuclease subunit S [Clostridia bacterium]
NDLETASDLFNMFKGAKAKFKTDDKRCKIVDIADFYNGTHWSVDRWWTRDEKIELGIEDNVETVSLEDYIGMVSDTASTLMEFDEPLRELVKKKSAITNSVEVSLDDKSLFDLSIGKRLLRKDYIDAKGDIPAYSANVFSPFVYTSHSNVDDLSVPYVLWGIDGTFEFNVMPVGRKFTYTDHCGVIKVKNPKINPYYLAYTLEENKHKYGFDRGLRASLSNMKLVRVSIPFDDTGEFDECAQASIADSMVGIRQLRENISEKKIAIKRAKVFIGDESFLCQYVPVEKVFDVIRGSGKYTKSYVQKHTGAYPLYSGNTTGVFATIDSFDFNCPCLSWAIDGLAGFMMIHNESFSATNHRGVLIPREDKLGLIDLQYMKYTLEPLFRAAKKGREGDNGENEYTTLPPFMIADIMVPVPVDDQGNISLDAQKEIAAKYLAIEQCKNEVISKLDTLIQQKIEL